MIGIARPSPAGDGSSPVSKKSLIFRTFADRLPCLRMVHLGSASADNYILNDRAKRQADDRPASAVASIEITPEMLEVGGKGAGVYEPNGFVGDDGHCRARQVSSYDFGFVTV